MLVKKIRYQGLKGEEYMRALLIEDDISTAHSIRLALRVHTVACDLAFNGHHGVELATSNPYDIILLDMLLPDMDGTDIIRIIRQKKIRTPILILSAMTQTDLKIRALQLGADDYMTKPFNNAELLARMKAIVKRAHHDIYTMATIGKINIDFNRHIVKVAGNTIKLTDKEYNLVELLILRRNKYTTKENIMLHLYGALDAAPIKVVNVFICRVRRKFEKASGGLNFIQTVWGLGYRLVEDGETTTCRQELFAGVRQLA